MTAGMSFNAADVVVPVYNAPDDLRACVASVLADLRPDVRLVLIDDASPDPVFYAYLHPQPPGCDIVPINPEGAAWVEQMGEWILPYEQVRTSEDPGATLREFLDCAYQLAGSLGGWDLKDHEYVKPSPPKRV